MNQKRYLIKLLMVALVVAMGARLYINVFVEGFIVTATAVVLGLALYYNEDVHPVHLGCLVALVSPGLRYGLDYLIYGADGLFGRVYPDAFFYIAYGVVFYLLKARFGEAYKNRFYIIVFFADLLSNTVELLVRTQVTDLTWTMIQGILLIAAGRTVIIMLVIYWSIYNSSLLAKQEHESRYEHLMMQSSRFKSEIYFLYKNMNQIEALVGVAHKLKIQAAENEALKYLALDLSKGVHEIKKDYLRVIRGLEEIYDEDMDFKEISLKDLFTILEVNTNEYLRAKNRDVLCSYRCRVDTMVKDHFYLMSVLRNLINNGIDACGDHGRIDVSAEEIDHEVVFVVKDDGEGIKESDRDFIFNTGYSSKFNEKTGDISRGIGLTLVQEMVVNVFKGSIEFESKPDEGTTFVLRMNPERLREGADYEVLYSR